MRIRGRRPGTPSWPNRQPPESVRFVGGIAEKRVVLGSLPLIAGYLKRSGLASVVDKVCPSAPQAAIRHSDAVVALVANRLTSPQPLYRVEEWAAEYAIETVLGIDPESVNDDRLAEALDAVAEKADQIETGMALHLQAQFDVALLAVHIDWTKVIFHGVYEAQNPDFAQVLMGGPSATVPSGTKVMNCEMAVAGSVPIRFKPHSGNTADSTTAIKAFDWIREVAQDKRLVVVGDTKLYTKANEQAVLLADCHMIAPMPWTKPLDEEIAGLPEGQWQLLEYMSERESLRPKKDQRRFWGQEKQVAVVIPVDKNGKVVTNKKLQRVAEFRNFVVRKVFIRSEEELQATRASRLKRMQKTDEELRHLQATVRNYKTTTQLTTKVEKMLVNRKLNEIYQITVTGPTEEDDTRPTSLTFTHNKSALARLEKNDGVYVLRTTPSTSEMSTDAVLREFKNQTRLESRFADYKGPLAVSPVYLKSNKRAVGLLVIVMLALQIYALIERDIRRTLEGQGGKMKGLYPEDRLSRPTTRQILRVFAKYGASLMRMGSRPVWVLDPLSAVQQEILRRLGIDTPGP